MNPSNTKGCALLASLAFGALFGCAGQNSKSDNDYISEGLFKEAVGSSAYSDLNKDVVWAVNVGGGEHTGADGVPYQSDIGVFTLILFCCAFVYFHPSLLVHFRHK